MEDASESDATKKRIYRHGDRHFNVNAPQPPGSEVSLDTEMDEPSDSGVEEGKVNTLFPIQKGFQNEFYHNCLTYCREKMIHLTLFLTILLTVVVSLNEGDLALHRNQNVNYA
jgi:hypothetical protein